MTFQKNSISNLTQKKPIRFLLFVIVIAVVVFAGKKLFDQRAQPSSSVLSTVQSTDAKASAAIGREFTFPLIKDARGNVTQDFKYYIDRAETRDEIVLKGQKATAVKGRDFLIITLKIGNGGSKAFKINTKDYIRLSSDGGNEWLSPSIHNDPVDVQAISTQPTRVGFYVNEGQKEFLLQIGEIEGNKEVINLTLK